MRWTTMSVELVKNSEQGTSVRKQLKRRFSFFQYKGRHVEMVTSAPYPWRISVDGEVKASIDGTLIQAKRAARELVNSNSLS
jgi:hypothetical protein